MSAFLKIDQAGLPGGVAGKSRTDGLATGALVTLTDVGPSVTTRFRLLWVALGDTTAAASLAVTGAPKVWTFSPTAARFGTYLVELIGDEGLPTEYRERRVIGVRFPVSGLLVPALNERGDPTASLVNAGAGPIEAADNNADDFSPAALNTLRYAAWWRAMQQLMTAVEALAGGGGGTVTSVFGRTGAVVAAAGDYDSTEVDNVSGVVGATVTAALNTLAGGITTVAASVAAVAATVPAAGPAPVDVSMTAAGAGVAATYSRSDHKHDIQVGRYLDDEGAGVPGVILDKTFNDIRDTFICGNLTSGSIGDLGWSTTATGTNSLTRLVPVDNHPGIIRLSAGGSATGRLSVHLGPASTQAVVDHFDSDFYDFLIRTSSLVPGVTNTRSITMGIGTNIDATNLGVDSMFFIAFPGTSIGGLPASNNWIAVCIQSTGGTSAVDTGVVATGTTNWRHFRIKRVPAVRYDFFIDNMVTPVASISSNIAGAPFNMGIRQANVDSNAGAHTLDWDEFYYRTNSLGSRIGP